MITLHDIDVRISDYLLGLIGGKQLVDCIDDAVSDDDVYEYAPDVQSVILSFQDILALYVEDPAKRSEHPSFYGPDQLKSVALDLQRSLRAVGSGASN